jgi:hypothetical protein
MAQGAARNTKELETQTNEAIKISQLSGEIEVQREKVVGLMRALQMEDEVRACACVRACVCVCVCVCVRERERERESGWAHARAADGG